MSTRLVAHEGSDCVMRYLPYCTSPTTTKAVREIVYGPARYAVVMRWKEGGQSMYLQRLHEMGLLARGGNGQ